MSRGGGCLLLVRHGASTFNLQNRFAGWTDAPLSDQGRAQTEAVAKGIRAESAAIRRASLLEPDAPLVGRIYSSALTRSLESARIIQRSLGLAAAPIVASYRLNERHYGILEGRDKVDAANEYGVEQVKVWRRGLEGAPPGVPREDPRHPAHDPRYHDVVESALPSTESLRDAIVRMLPLWRGEIGPAILDGGPVLICAHGSTVRGILTVLEGLEPEAILELNIPNGYPILCRIEAGLDAAPSAPSSVFDASALRLDDGRTMRLLERRYLGDAAAARRHAEAVARQAIPKGEESRRQD